MNSFLYLKSVVMSPRQTKTFKRNQVSFPLLGAIFAVATVIVLYATGVFSFASSTNSNTISDADRVSVE